MSKISQQRRTDILNAAYAEFSIKGIDGTSMTDIASRAGIGKSTIYEYFPSKKQMLMDACFQFVKDMERDIFEKLSQDGSVQEKVLAYCVITRNYMAMVEALGGMAHRSTTAVDELRGMVETYIKGHTQRVEDKLREVLLQGQQQGEIRGDVDMEITPVILRSLPSMQLVWGLERLQQEDGLERVVAQVFAGLN